MRVLWVYQKSGMETVKWHMQDNVTVDNFSNGGLFFCDAVIYEYSHTIFKQSYATKSKRRIYAMYESNATVEHRLRDDTANTPR